MGDGHVHGKGDGGHGHGKGKGGHGHGKGKGKDDSSEETLPAPTVEPIAEPSESPSQDPTGEPTESPSQSPTISGPIGIGLLDHTAPSSEGRSRDGGLTLIGFLASPAEMTMTY